MTALTIYLYRRHKGNLKISFLTVSVNFATLLPKRYCALTQIKVTWSLMTIITQFFDQYQIEQ